MSMHFPLMINGQRIGQFEASRVSGMQAWDGPAGYLATFDLGGHRTTVRVEHSPADGAWTLLRKAIEAMEAN